MVCVLGKNKNEFFLQVESVTISDNFELVEYEEQGWNAPLPVSHTEPVKEVSLLSSLIQGNLHSRCNWGGG